MGIEHTWCTYMHTIYTYENSNNVENNSFTFICVQILKCHFNLLTSSSTGEHLCFFSVFLSQCEYSISEHGWVSFTIVVYRVLKCLWSTWVQMGSLYHILFLTSLRDLCRSRSRNVVKIRCQGGPEKSVCSGLYRMCAFINIKSFNTAPKRGRSSWFHTSSLGAIDSW